MEKGKWSKLRKVEPKYITFSEPLKFIERKNIRVPKLCHKNSRENKQVFR